MKKERVLMVGAGDVAKRLIPRLVARFTVIALTSSAASAAELRLLGVLPIIGNLDDRASLKRLSGLATRIFHFAPPPNSGHADLGDSRTRNLLAILARPASRAAAAVPRALHITYISTTGVYGDCAGARFDETRTVNPQNPRAHRRVAAEALLRQAVARRGKSRAVLQVSIRASILRVPGIYAANRLPLERLQRGTPALCEADDVYTNHIHADDLAHAAWCAQWSGRPGRVYHITDDTELKMGDYFDLVADAFGLARPPRITRAEAPQKIAPPLLSFMSESRRLTNARMKRELGVQLRYRTVEAGVAAALAALLAG